MTATGPEPEAATEQAAAVGEPRQMSEGVAKAILLVVALGAMWGIVAAAPWVAYFVVGVLATLGWQKVGGWIAKRRGNGDDEQDDVDVVAALQTLGRGGRSVLLTELRDELGVKDTKAVKALLDEAGVRWRGGVRAPAGNGPGVHHEDIPAPSPAGGGGPGERCSCSSAANTNANNTPPNPPGEGLSVEAIGQAGAIVRDPADAVRHHQVGG